MAIDEQDQEQQIPFPISMPNQEYSTGNPGDNTGSYNLAYQRLMQHENQFPQYDNYKPDWKRRLLAGIVGGAAAYGDSSSHPPNPALGIQTAQEIKNRPYATATKNWQMEEQPLEKQVQLETGRLSTQAMQMYRQQMADAATKRADSTVGMNTARAQHFANLDDPDSVAAIERAKTQNQFHTFQPGAFAGFGSNIQQVGTPASVQTENLRQRFFPQQQEIIGARQQENTRLHEGLRGANNIAAIQKRAELTGQNLSPSQLGQIDKTAKNNLVTSGIYSKQLQLLKGQDGKLDWTKLDASNPQHQPIVDALRIESNKVLGTLNKGNKSQSNLGSWVPLPEEDDEDEN